ncbi:hypothetical protein C8F01DRAFT_1230893 [Mycena amicta]|nr:hypothetical protein C8F01DRAFT_1230893 [Mycena amicta]
MASTNAGPVAFLLSPRTVRPRAPILVCPPHDVAGDGILKATVDFHHGTLTCTYFGAGNVCTYHAGLYASGPSTCFGAPPGIGASPPSRPGEPPETSSPHSDPTTPTSEDDPSSTIPPSATDTSSLSIDRTTSKSIAAVTTASAGGSIVVIHFSPTTTSATATSTLADADTSGLAKKQVPMAAIVGSILGVMAFVMLLALGFTCWRRNRNAQRRRRELAESSILSNNNYFNGRGAAPNTNYSYGAYTGDDNHILDLNRDTLSWTSIGAYTYEERSDIAYTQGSGTTGLGTSRPPSYAFNREGAAWANSKQPGNASARGSRVLEVPENVWPAEKSRDRVRSLERELQFKYS